MYSVHYVGGTTISSMNLLRVRNHSLYHTIRKLFRHFRHSPESFDCALKSVYWCWWAANEKKNTTKQILQIPNDYTFLFQCYSKKYINKQKADIKMIMDCILTRKKHPIYIFSWFRWSNVNVFEKIKCSRKFFWLTINFIWDRKYKNDFDECCKLESWNEKIWFLKDVKKMRIAVVI